MVVSLSDVSCLFVVVAAAAAPTAAVAVCRGCLLGEVSPWLPFPELVSSGTWLRGSAAVRKELEWTKEYQKREREAVVSKEVTLFDGWDDAVGLIKRGWFLLRKIAGKTTRVVVSGDNNWFVRGNKDEFKRVVSTKESLGLFEFILNEKILEAIEKRFGYIQWLMTHQFCEQRNYIWNNCRIENFVINML